MINVKQYVIKKRNKFSYMSDNDGFFLLPGIMRNDSLKIYDCKVKQAYEDMNLKWVFIVYGKNKTKLNKGKIG